MPEAIREQTEQTAARIPLTETYAFRSLHEDVSAFGLDPEDYRGVLEADLGMAGVVNLNGRIYIPDEFVPENVALAERARVETVDAEEEHPEAGPTFRVAARVLPPRTEKLPNGAVKARGMLALVKNAHGENIRRLHRIGIPIGISSRGWGVAAPHTLDERSPYRAMNPDRVGETVLLIQGFKLETYDFVRVPSAGTYADPHTAEAREAREALAALTEARILREAPTASVPTTEPDEALEDSDMDPKTIEELRQKFPSLVAQLEADLRKDDPFAKLDEGKRKLATEIALRVAEATDPKAGAAVDPALRQAVEGLKADVAKAQREANEAAQVLRDRVQAVEQTNESLRAENDRLREERDREKLARELAGAVDAACKAHEKHAARLRGWLEAKVQAGALRTVEAVAAEAKSAFDLLEGVATELRNATGAVTVTPVDENADDGITKPPVTEAPGVLGEDAFLASIFKATEAAVAATAKN